jgi:hypothetical protein
VPVALRRLTIRDCAILLSQKCAGSTPANHGSFITESEGGCNGGTASGGADRVERGGAGGLEARIVLATHWSSRDMAKAIDTGAVIGKCYARHRAQEFRRFLDDIERWSRRSPISVSP